MNTDYSDYLCSPHWQTMRALALDAAKHHCALCRSEYKLEVHHNTYSRLGHERMDDLIVLCGDCHSSFHGKLPGDDTDLVKRVKSALDSATTKQTAYIAVRAILAEAEDTPERVAALRLVADALELVPPGAKDAP